MAEPSSFDDLVRELSHEERRDLLYRIRGAAKVSDEPLFRDEEAVSPAVDYEARYQALGVVARLLVALKAFFRGATRAELVKERILAEVAQRVDQRSPGLVDARRGLLLDRFAVELLGLRDGCRWFVDVLDRALEKDKGAFYAFLASVQLELVHSRLWNDADPFSIAEKDSSLDEAGVRAAVWASYEDALASVSEDQRRQMYADVRALLFLRKLSSFLYDRVLGAFETDPTGRRSAVLSALKDALGELASILASMSHPPSLKLMESLLVYSDRDRFGSGDFDAESEVGRQLGQADAALARVRAFNQRVPLVGLVQLALGDPNWRPHESAGGEEWFALLRGFWRERLERAVARYSASKAAETLGKEIAEFAGTMRPFENIKLEDSERSPGLHLAPLLGFLDRFYRNVFLSEFNRPLKIVLLDGEFYKKDNRIEFTDAYNTLLQIDERTRALDRRLGPGGELSEAWIQAKADMGHPHIRLRRIQGASALAAAEAEDFVSGTIQALRTMVAVLQGILTNEVGGKYDSLANLHYLEGRANKDFIKILAQVRARMERALYFIDALASLDLGGEA